MDNKRSFSIDKAIAKGSFSEPYNERTLSDLSDTSDNLLLSSLKSSSHLTKKNIEHSSLRNKPTPIFNKKKWHIYWSVLIISFLFIEIPFNGNIPVVFPTYQALSYVIFIASFIIFIVAVRSIPGGYSMIKQAICHIGRIVTKKGDHNHRASFLFLVFSILEGSLIYLGENLVIQYSRVNQEFVYLPIGMRMTILGAMMTAAVPIDVDKKLHYFWALIGFSSNVYMNSYVFVHVLGHLDQFFFVFLADAFLLIFAALYMVGFLLRYRYAALFQKLWIFFSTLCFFLYIDYFLSFL